MRFLIAVIFVGLSAAGLAQQSEPGKVNWMTFEEAVAASKVEKKKIFIDVYTDWCGWCKVMDKNTFSQKVIAEYLNENFYPVKLDGEQKESIEFRGTTFKYVPSGQKGYHQLAAALMNGQLSYPTVVFLDEEFNMLQPLKGYQKPAEFDMILKFLGDNHFKSTKWEEFQKTYNSSF